MKKLFEKLFIAVCADVYLTILISVIVIVFRMHRNELLFTSEFFAYGVILFPIICCIMMLKDRITSFLGRRYIEKNQQDNII